MTIGALARRPHRPHHHHHHHHHAGGKLHAISTRHAVLAAHGFAAGHQGIAAAKAHGWLEPVSLSNLSLNQSYVPRTNDAGMTHRRPGGFEWDRSDQLTRGWFPQGITTSSDANASGTVGGRKWVATTWHSGHGNRSRISFVDVTHPNDPRSAKYRHVELVVPDPKRPGHMKPLPLHVGGVSWVGDYVYVADTHGGMRVFDMRNLSRLKNPAAAPHGTLPYVLPQVGAYQLPARAKHHGDTPVFSGLSLDRSHGRLISQEFSRHKGGVIASWPIDLHTGRLRSHHGVVHANHEWSSPVSRMAGVLARGDGFDMVQMGHPHSHLLHAKVGHRAVVKDTLARNSQQFAWDAQLRQIWALGEARGHRGVWHFRPE